MEDYAKKSAMFVILFSIGAFLIGAMSVYIWQQVQNQNQIDDLKDQNKQLQDQLDAIIKTDQQPSESINQPNQEGEQTPTKVVVTFEPGNKFPDSLRSELHAKFIDPAALFYKNDSRYLVAIHMSESPDDNSYLGLLIFNDDSYKLEAFGTKSKLDQPIWRPDCISQCKFSDEFRLAFPLIVSEYQQ